MAAAAKEAGLTVQRFCTFWVGDQHYGLDVESVREVLKSQSTTLVPAASQTIRGLINLRGEIVTAIDLRRRLDLPEVDGEAPTMNVVVSLAGEVISLIVDAVGDVVDLPIEALVDAPATVPPVVRDMTVGVYRQDGGLLQILDASRLVPDEDAE